MILVRLLSDGGKHGAIASWCSENLEQELRVSPVVHAIGAFNPNFGSARRLYCSAELACHLPVGGFTDGWGRNTTAGGGAQDQEQKDGPESTRIGNWELET
jgi:hypothetical protein